ncbi:sperm surface protein Sp17 [Polyodon spathula]|uniref:sperm surface protein Sp17 n=1 Tax=Polyodon spathula TaxID=7913 RepID=UPI001B7EE0B4|nr:sperm surface protein Sp17 [Polyodon spathula]
MSVPFSNTSLRVPRGFGNVLQGLAREVLREQPKDIPAFAAQYFRGLLLEREKSGIDPVEWGAAIEDRFYNNQAFKSDSHLLSGEAGEQMDFDSPDKEEAIIKIQASYRGYAVRQTLKKSATSENEDTSSKDKEPVDTELIEAACAATTSTANLNICAEELDIGLMGGGEADDPANRDVCATELGQEPSLDLLFAGIADKDICGEELQIHPVTEPEGSAQETLESAAKEEAATGAGESVIEEGDHATEDHKTPRKVQTGDQPSEESMVQAEADPAATVNEAKAEEDQGQQAETAMEAEPEIEAQPVMEDLQDEVSSAAPVDATQPIDQAEQHSEIEVCENETTETQLKTEAEATIDAKAQNGSAEKEEEKELVKDTEEEAGDQDVKQEKEDPDGGDTVRASLETEEADGKDQAPAEETEDQSDYKAETEEEIREAESENTEKDLQEEQTEVPVEETEIRSEDKAEEPVEQTEVPGEETEIRSEDTSEEPVEEALAERLEGEADESKNEGKELHEEDEEETEGPAEQTEVAQSEDKAGNEGAVDKAEEVGHEREAEEKENTEADIDNTPPLWVSSECAEGIQGHIVPTDTITCPHDEND